MPKPHVPSAPLAKRRVVKRDAAATREKILQAAIFEFSDKGLNGARTADIARRARCNIRMVYHYFGSKDRLYVAALERVYGQIRAEEEALDLASMDPVTGIVTLVGFTFDHMAQHREFVQLAVIENIQRGRYMKKSVVIPQRTQPLIQAIRKLLIRGQDQGLFKRVVDATQLYVSILALSLTHLSNRYTLSITYRTDMADPKWLRERRQHVQDLVLAYLCSVESAEPPLFAARRAEGSARVYSDA
jgi:AcrR family transcriptional regulator